MESKRQNYSELLGIIVAAVLAILCGFIIICLTSKEPLNAISALILGPFDNLLSLSRVINKAIPLVFTGLAIAVVFKANIFNMGGEGQLYIGGFLGALVAVYGSNYLPPLLAIPLAIIFAMIGGALFGFIPGILKAKVQANEVVMTLMLNYIAIALTSYLINNVFKDPASGGFARMKLLGKEMQLSPLTASFPAHYGIFIAIAAVIFVYFLLYKTKVGYEIRLVGQNDSFAKYGGIFTQKVIVISVMISGALAGLAGIVEILGVHGTYKDNFSAGLGFDGIVISLLARNHPIGVFFAALFYAYLQVGGQIMQADSDLPRELSQIIQVLLVLFVSATAVFKYFQQKKLMKEKAV